MLDDTRCVTHVRLIRARHSCSRSRNPTDNGLRSSRAWPLARLQLKTITIVTETIAITA